MDLFRRPVMSGAKFLVWIGPVMLGFSKVQGLKKKTELTPVREGGVNDRVHMLPSPAQQNERVTFERGWCGSAVEAGLFRPGCLIPGGIGIQVMDADGIPAGMFFLLDPIVESWELSDLSAMDSAVLIRRFSVIHAGIEEAPARI